MKENHNDPNSGQVTDRESEDLTVVAMPQLYAEIDASTNLFIAYVDGKQQECIGAEYGNTLYLIESFVELVLSGERAFATEVTDRGYLKPLALAPYFNLINSFLALYSPTKVYSPHVDLFFNVLQVKHGIMPGYFSKYPDRFAPAHSKKEGQFFDQLIEEIFIQGNQRSFRRRLYARTEVIERGFTSGKRYVDDLYVHYSRLLVLRVDFSFRTATPSAPHPVSLQEAQEYLVRFMNNRRGKTLYASMVGYIWRLEFGREKGYHYHVFFFFDGARVRKDEYIASEIGADWIRLTDSKGTFYNCNAHKQKYKCLGIGMISHDDQEKRNQLLTVLRYMHKQDQTLREKHTEKTHVWGRGIPPKRTESVVGRPRRCVAGPNLLT